MIASSIALQTAIYSALTASTELTAQLGGPRIYDDAPQATAFPYITFGQSVLRDASTATDPGDEHIFTIHVWSRAQGRRETHAILDTVRSLLHDRALTLTNHRLINLRHEFSDTRRDPDGETIHGLCRLRAVTEPIP
jgi:Protein of unknown function (DUF3168)